MARRTRSQWQALFDAQAASGQTAAEFCRQQGVNAKYFSLRRHQLSEVSESLSSSFVPVSVKGIGPGDKITVRDERGVTVELPLAIEPRWLAQLVQALRD
jgi:hypothetical protein